MKKYILIIFFILFYINAYPQYKLGLAVQPGILVNRVYSDPDTLNFSNDGSKLKFWLGLYVDIEIKENYYFTTGLYWAPKRIGLILENATDKQNLNIKLQYLQIPLLLKLLTDEIALDKRIYFNLGPTIEFKLEESFDNNKSTFYIDKINFWDISLHFGAGMDIKIGRNTIISGGLSYYRGMANVIKTDDALSSNLRIKNDFYAINLGIKF